MIRFAWVGYQRLAHRGAEASLRELHALSAKRIVFPLRMPHPVFRHKNAAQVGVPAKANTEHVENLSFRKVRSGVDIGDAWHHGVIFRHRNFKKDAPARS